MKSIILNRPLTVLFVGMLGVSGLITPAAEAVYTGLSVELHNQVTINGTDRWVYRVYANFTDPNDRFIEVFGTSSNGSFIESRNSTDTGPGGDFFNTVIGTTAPTQSLIDINPNARWDSFVTIGVSVADQAVPFDQTSLLPEFPSLSGNSFTMSNSAWYVVPTFDHDNNPGTPDIPPAQTLAGFAGDGDMLNRVMVLQLTVNAGDNVRGSLNLITFQPFPGGSTPNHFNQTFNSIPASGAIGFLAMAGIIGRRRSRKA